MLAVAALMGVTPGSGSAQTGCFESFTPGVSPLRDPNGQINAVATLDLGSGPELYVTGGFTRVANVPAWRLAKFNGTTWTAIGSNSPSAITLEIGVAFAAFDDGTGLRLFVAGKFAVPGSTTWVEQVGRWDGAAWTLLGTTADAPINALRVFDDGSGPKLVAAGSFATISGVAASKVAKWNGSTWSPIGSGLGGLYGFVTVLALEAYDSGAGPDLYAGGIATGVAPGCSLARWTGTQWVPAGYPGLTSVTALGIHSEPGPGPVLLVAGQFPAGTFAPVPRSLATFDGTNWTPIATVSGGSIAAVASFDDGSGPAICFGGYFTAVTGTTMQAGFAVSHVARHQNGNVTALDTGLPGAGVSSFAMFPLSGAPALVAAGSFSSQSPVESTPSNLGRWTGTAWAGLSDGMRDGGSVDALALFDDGAGTKLYAGGRFHTIASAVANGFARWNGATWEGIGAPLSILSMAAFDDGSGPALFVAGSATSPGGTRVARWNGTSFTSVGGAITSTVDSLVVWDDGTGPGLWAGGEFSTQLGSLARWKGVGWEGLPQIIGALGPAGTVSKLLAEPGAGGALILAGSFTSICGIPVSNIVRLVPPLGAAGFVDALGGGLPGPVSDVVIHDDGSGPHLYALTTGYSLPAPTLVRFDGASWSNVHTLPGNGTLLRSMPSQNGRALYVGGCVAGPSPAPGYFQRLDGLTWTTVGGGLDGGPADLAAFDDGGGWAIFVAGTFAMAGGVPSGGVARLVIPTPTILHNPAGGSFALGAPIVLSVNAVGPPPLSYQWLKDGYSIATATAPSLAIPSATFADAGSYEVLVMNGCGGINSTPAEVQVRGLDLAISQLGPGTIAVSQSGGPPGAHAFTAFSVLSANATSPGTGNLFGLHVAIEDALAQFLTQSPPFVTTLSASGSSIWAAGPLPPSLIGVTVWGVSTLYDPAVPALVGAPSLIAQQLLQ